MLKSKPNGQEDTAPILHMRTLRHRKIEVWQFDARLPEQLRRALGQYWGGLIMTALPTHHLDFRGDLCSEMGRASQEDLRPLDPEGQVHASRCGWTSEGLF